MIKHESDHPKNKQWVLYTKDGSKVLGAHPSKAQALAQEAAVEVAKHARGARQARELSASTGIARHVTLDGRPHTVVPVVALLEGVIHASNSPQREFVSEAVLAASVDEWEGRPLVFNHPQMRGERLSATDPAGNAAVFGQVRNARMKGTKLAFDAYIDDELAKAVGADDIVQKALAGTPMEVSVGVYTVLDQVGGTYGGKEYSARWARIYPDHFAVLPPGVPGACSVEMGCGLARAASAAGGTKVEKKHGPKMLSRDAVARICPRCAEKMDEKNLSAVSLDRLARSPRFLAAVEKVEGETIEEKVERALGGVGSGFFGHGGRPGEVGGSSSEGGGNGTSSGKSLDPVKVESTILNAKKGEVVYIGGPDGQYRVVPTPSGYSVTFTPQVTGHVSLDREEIASSIGTAEGAAKRIVDHAENDFQKYGDSSSKTTKTEADKAAIESARSISEARKHEGHGGSKTPSEGDRVKVMGKVNGAGKTGIVESSMGSFHYVTIGKGTASYHSSDLKVLSDVSDRVRAAVQEALRLAAEPTGPSDDELRTSIQDALYTEMEGEDVSVWVNQLWEQDGVCVYCVTPVGGGESTYFRRSYTVDADGNATLGDDAEEVRQHVDYVPVVNPQDQNPTDRKASSQESRAASEGAGDDDSLEEDGTLDDEDDNQEEEGMTQEELDTAVQTKIDAAKVEAKVEAQKQVEEVRATSAKEIAELRTEVERSRPIVAEHEARVASRKLELVEGLKTLSAFDEKTLQEMPLAVLEGIQKTVEKNAQVVDFSGRGAPRAAASTGIPPAPPMFPAAS